MCFPKRLKVWKVNFSNTGRGLATLPSCDFLKSQESIHGREKKQSGWQSPPTKIDNGRLAAWDSHAASNRISATAISKRSAQKIETVWPQQHPGTRNIQFKMFFSCCFSWKALNHYIKNGCFIKHPLKHCCFGYQDYIDQSDSCVFAKCVTCPCALWTKQKIAQLALPWSRVCN